jgi:hypothetical protein
MLALAELVQPDLPTRAGLADGWHRCFCIALLAEVLNLAFVGHAVDNIVDLVVPVGALQRQI